MVTTYISKKKKKVASPGRSRSEVSSTGVWRGGKLGWLFLDGQSPPGASRPFSPKGVMAQCFRAGRALRA